MMEPTALSLLRLRDYLINLAHTALSVRCVHIRVPLAKVRQAAFPEQKGGEALVTLMLPSKVIVNGFSFDIYIDRTSKGVYVHLLRSDVEPPDYLIPISVYRQRLLSSRRNMRKWWQRVVQLYEQPEVFRVED